MKSQLLCLQRNHQEQRILGACKNKNCKIKRFCIFCEDDQHKDHQNDLLPFKNLILYEKDRKELADKIISKFTHLTETLNKLIEQQTQLKNNNKSIFDMNGSSFEEYVSLLIKAEEFEVRLVDLFDEFQRKLDQLKNGNIIHEEQFPILPYENQQQQQYQLLFQINKPNSIFSFPIDDKSTKFLFSKDLKGPNVQIHQNQKSYISDDLNQFALLVPKLNPDAISKLRIQLIEKNGINQALESEIGVCCSLDLMKKKDFIIKALDPGNRTYLVQDYGRVAKNGKKEQSYQQFGYQFGDVLTLQADLQKKKLYLKNESRNQLQEVDLDVELSNLNDWYFCIYSYSFKVQLLDI